MNLPTSRRDFLNDSARVTGAAGLGLLLGGSVAAAAQDEGAGTEPAKGSMLILGGTRFLGPQIVRAALAAGWEVTLFNRGRSNPELFKDLDQRVGDRNTSDYASLAEGEWDLVIDTSCYIPKHVSAAIEAIQGRAGHYVVVSTISVYADSDDKETVVPLDAPLGQVEPEKLSEFEVIQDVGKYGSRYYGALKALCEQAAEEAMPGAVTVVRPGLIVGPEDGSDRYTYWPVRVAEGGNVLAPGDPDVGVQYIDVRDLGVFTFNVGARRVGGIMNGVGFDAKVTMKQMIESCIPKGHNAPEVELTWVPDEFLMEQKVGPWMELPLWIPGGGRTYTNERARKEGLTFRSLEDTAKATFEWHRDERGSEYEWRGAGLARDKEAKVLAAWASKDD